MAQRTTQTNNHTSVSATGGADQEDSNSGCQQFNKRLRGVLRNIFSVKKKSRLKRSDSFYEKFNRVINNPAAKKTFRKRFLQLFTLTFWKTVAFSESGSIYFRWLMVVSIAAMYNLTLVIGRCVFTDINQSALPVWLTLDYICDAIYIADILFSMRVGHLENGILVTDTKVLRLRYCKSWRFVFDLLSCVPTDVFYPLCPLGIDQTEIRFNRLLKSYKILEFKELNETRTSHPLIAKMVGLLVTVTLILHWNACIYFFLSDQIGIGSDIFVYPPAEYLALTDPSASHSDTSHDTSTTNETSTTTNSSSSAHLEMASATASTGVLTMLINSSAVSILGAATAAESSSATDHGTSSSSSSENSNSTSSTEFEIDPIWFTLTRKYIYCFYWATITQTIIADNPLPQAVGEAFFMILNFTVAVIVFDVIIVTVGSVIRSSNAKNEEFQSMMDGVKRYMRFREVNARLRKRVLKWFDFLYAHPHHEDHVLEVLPDSLRVEIAMSIHYDTLKRVPIFEGCEFSLLMELVTKLKLETFGPGDYVCRKGDIGKELYIVKRGKLEVVSPDGKVVFVTLNEGSVFGEITVLDIPGNKTEGRRSANVRSFGYSDLFVLCKDDLWEALKDFPEAKKKLIERGAAILRKDKLLDEEAFEIGTRANMSPVQQLEAMHDSIDKASVRLASLISRFNNLQADFDQRLRDIEDNAPGKRQQFNLATLAKNGTGQLTRQNSY